MADVPKPPFQRFPLTYPAYYPGLNPDQLKQLQANFARTGPTYPPLPPATMPSAPLMNPRLYQHFANTMRMGPMPPMWPYMPYGRPAPMPMPLSEGPNSAWESEKKSPAQQTPLITRAPSNRVIEIEEGETQHKKNRTEKIQKRPDKNAPSKLISLPISPPEASAVKPSLPKKFKEARHASTKKYEGPDPKKKQKREEVLGEANLLRETREKKQTIEKLMAQVMKGRPKRERVMKIGKDHQAIIPESYINEYEYQLKIKMEKKQELLTRLVSASALPA